MEKIMKWRIPLSIFLGIVQLFIIIGLVTSILNKRPEENEEEWLVGVHSQSQAENVTEVPAEQELIYWVVDIKGAVSKPGIYEVAKNMRVQDAIDLAGGLLPNAETRQLNFAQHLADQMLIYVPVEGEEVEISASSDSVATEDNRKININTANEQELQALPGIGEKKALQIVSYRTENGSFATAEDLMEVSGIGQKTFDALKELITITK